MQWRIRRALPADVDTLALIGAATFLDAFAGVLDGDAIVAHCAREHSAARYGEYLRDGGRAWLATIEPGGAPIGFALIAPADLPGAASDGSDLELKRIYTLSRVFGQGVGKALMAEAVAEARAAGARRLLLGVYKQNGRAIAFYGKQGFQPIGTRQFRVGDQLCDDLVLAKPLD